MSRTLLTAGQVAERAGVHRSTVHHWEKDGKLDAAEVVNGIRLWDAEVVDALVADRAALAVEPSGRQCTSNLCGECENADDLAHEDWHRGGDQ
ncbi:MAG: MerR family DNA-binding transcriptional regulator [Acidimicrobiia bacterium]|nr:MerR family DNA-binding transcriptional regulator [Acidimicrobiia bacterium]